MHCVGGNTLVSVLFVAVLITLFLPKTFSLLVYLQPIAIHSFARSLCLYGGICLPVDNNINSCDGFGMRVDIRVYPCTEDTAFSNCCSHTGTSLIYFVIFSTES